MAAFRGHGRTCVPIDHAILAALEQDGRRSFAKLAEAVGLAKTPCWTRVQALEEAGVIRGYAADIDPKALGLGVLALVEVMIDFSRRAEFEQPVLESPAILEWYTTAGEPTSGVDASPVRAILRR